MNWDRQRITFNRDGVCVWEIQEHEARGERDGAACMVIEPASWHATADVRTSIVKFERSERAALEILRDKLRQALSAAESRLDELKREEDGGPPWPEEGFSYCNSECGGPAYCVNVFSHRKRDR